MNQFEAKQSQPQLQADEGWLVQIYSSNRRLLCVLEPSHAWVFLTGCCIGLLSSVIWVNLARSPSLAEPTLTPEETPVFQID